MSNSPSITVLFPLTSRLIDGDPTSHTGPFSPRCQRRRNTRPIALAFVPRASWSASAIRCSKSIEFRIERVCLFIQPCFTWQSPFQFKNFSRAWVLGFRSGQYKPSLGLCL